MDPDRALNVADTRTNRVELRGTALERNDTIIFGIWRDNFAQERTGNKKVRSDAPDLSQAFAIDLGLTEVTIPSLVVARASGRGKWGCAISRGAGRVI